MGMMYRYAAVRRMPCRLRRCKCSYRRGLLRCPFYCDRQCESLYERDGQRYRFLRFLSFKAKNSYGTSDYSNTCSYEFADQRKPGPPTITSATCSGNNITIRWRVPTDASYGKPTSAKLMVSNPDTGKAVELQSLSGSATSVTFNYLLWINSIGAVNAAIYLENEWGTSGSTVTYNTKTGEFYYNR